MRSKVTNITYTLKLVKQEMPNNPTANRGFVCGNKTRAPAKIRFEGVVRRAKVALCPSFNGLVNYGRIVKAVEVKKVNPVSNYFKVV